MLLRAISKNTHSDPARPGGDTRRGWLATLMLLSLLLALPSLALTGCEELEEEPSIISVTVDPSTIQYNHYNGSMTVLISIAGFTGEISEADAFIETDTGSERVAVKESFSAEGNDIELHGVPRTWLKGLAPGSYSVGANVISSAGENITQSDLGTVEVVE